MPQTPNGTGGRPPRHAELESCVACGRPTVLVPTLVSRGEKRIPLDPQPAEDGDWIVSGGLAHRIEQRAPSDSARRYHGHYSTCPFAKRWLR